MATERTEIVLGTKNHGKISEFRSLLKGISVRLFSFHDFPDVPLITDTGKTFEEIAGKRAKTIAKAAGRIAIAEDSGLEVDYLNGEPGIRSARFAGKTASARENARRVLKLLDTVPWEERTARLVCVICAADAKGKAVYAQGSINGKISFEMRGSHGFGYDPVFIPDGHQLTMAEMDAGLKKQISHQAVAMKKYRKILKDFIGKQKP